MDSQESYSFCWFRVVVVVVGGGRGVGGIKRDTRTHAKHETKIISKTDTCPDGHTPLKLENVSAKKFSWRTWLVLTNQTKLKKLHLMHVTETFDHENCSSNFEHHC